MSEPQPQQNVSGKLQGLAQAFLQYARARVDLLQHEWRQEQSRLLGQLARTGIFALGALISLQLICAFVLIAFWDTPWRLHAAGGLVLLFGSVTGLAWRGMQGGRDHDSQAFSSTIAAFDKDREIFDRLAELRDEAKKPGERAPPSPSAIPVSLAAARTIPEPTRYSDSGRSAAHTIEPAPPASRANGASTPASSRS
ncbi:MAG: putative rane protein YqjE [Hydrocarboniphaga sp.]|uniref:phage holin family protein n=1 Tax=Hydrocarboniphaga sp. TaxID=2033016 RepID=UPI002601A0F7|nr:phage holin family protein [Hydrocarboniphaga sp.]MDB5970861.1 putative rane protein YqjE [Hydrocarboniphaga sp.]